VKVKAKATAVLACCWSIAVLSFSPLAHAAADPHVLTQTCPNGDKIALNMTKKTLAFTRGSQTYHATYDDGYAITWAADNPTARLREDNADGRPDRDRRRVFRRWRRG